MHKKHILIPLVVVLLSGCNSNQKGPGLFSWETFGINSTETHNNHVDEAKKNHKDDLDNQTEIAKLTASVASELKYIAKKADDQPAFERAVILETKAGITAEDASQLSNVEWSKAPPPADWMGNLISLILQALGIGSTGGMGYMAIKLLGARREIQNTQAAVQEKELVLKRVKKKAIKFAQSEHRNDISDDDDLV